MTIGELKIKQMWFRFPVVWRGKTRGISLKRYQLLEDESSKVSEMMTSEIIMVTEAMIIRRHRGSYSSIGLARRG